MCCQWYVLYATDKANVSVWGRDSRPNFNRRPPFGRRSFFSPSQRKDLLLPSCCSISLVQIIMLRLVSLVLLVLWQPYAFAFSPAAPQSRLLTTPLASDAASDFGSAMPEEVSPYERLGITRDQLALGINPEDVLNYCGT